MDAHDAREMALELMERHGLIRDGWRFAWSRARRQLGCVQITEKKNRSTGKRITIKTLRLSRPHAETCDEPAVRDTVLHEIAHALVGMEHGHDAVWKAKCVEIGARPERLAGEDASPGGHKYFIVCGVCEQVLGKRFRAMKAQRVRDAYCKHCGPGSRGKLRQETAGGAGAQGVNASGADARAQ